MLPLPHVHTAAARSRASRIRPESRRFPLMFTFPGSKRFSHYDTPEFPVWVATHAEVAVPILVLVVLLAAVVAYKTWKRGSLKY